MLFLPEFLTKWKTESWTYDCMSSKIGLWSRASAHLPPIVLWQSRAQESANRSLSLAPEAVRLRPVDTFVQSICLAVYEDGDGIDSTVQPNCSNEMDKMLKSFECRQLPHLLFLHFHGFASLLQSKFSRRGYESE